MTLQDIKSAVRKLDRNDMVELRSFVNTVASSSSDLRRGMKVHFTHSKTGAIIEGMIKKVNRKTIRIDSKQDEWGKDRGYFAEWIVPPSMVEVA